MLQRLTAGGPVQLSASTWGAFVDSTEYFRKHLELKRERGHYLDQRDTGIVSIRNDTGDDRLRGEVIEIHAYTQVIAATANHKLWFSGEGPLESRGFGICLDPIKAGKIGDVQVAGVCKAKINIGSTNHKWARPKQGQFELESGGFGPCYILHRPTSAGDDLEATVVIAQPHMVLMATCELAEDMCAIENAVLDPETFTPIKNGPFLLTPDPIPEEALNLFGREAQDGDLVLLFYDGEEDSWFVAVVTPHSFTFGGLVEVDTVGMVITQETLEGVVETCMQSQTQTIANLTECPEEGS